MTYRLGEGLADGGGYGGAGDPGLTTGELPSRGRPGAHSSDRLDAGQHRYTYQRPADAPRRTRARHAAPADDELGASAQTPFGRGSRTPSVGGSWTSTTQGRDHAAAQSFSWREAPAVSAGWEGDAYSGLAAPMDDVGAGYGSRWESNRGGEPSAWDERALQAAAGVAYRPHHRFTPDDDLDFGPGGSAGMLGSDQIAGLAPGGVGTLTATRPLRAAPYPAQRRAPEAETEVAEPEAAEGAEAEVPVAPPITGGRLRFLGKKHAGLRIAAVSVLIVGSAVGIAVGVLRDSDSDTVKVTEDIQADAANPAVPTPDSNPGQTQPAPAGAELLAKQRQQAALDAAKKLAASKAAAAKAAAAEQAEQAESARASRSASPGTTGDTVPTAPVDCDTYSGNRATGCALLQEFGFETTQMDCLDKLWTRESQWTTSAENSSSGAYGIPQALPGSKMASVADDWQTNAATQIRWGLGYIKGRYTSPCGAWAHSEANGWY